MAAGAPILRARDSAASFKDIVINVDRCSLAHALRKHDTIAHTMSTGHALPIIATGANSNVPKIAICIPYIVITSADHDPAAAPNRAKVTTSHSSHVEVGLGIPLANPASVDVDPK
jgi:hypothetical protein